MDIYLARTQGFCAGVSFAIEVVNNALKNFGLPLYVYHEIVHNKAVVQDFKQRGVVFVEDLHHVPRGHRVIFSAHGVPPAVVTLARELGLQALDATCPLVKKVHIEAVRFSNKGYPTVLLGHRGHQEMIGTAGYIKPELLHIVETVSDIDSLVLDPDQPVAYLTQTTLSVAEAQDLIARLKQRFPRVISPPSDDICYATQNRQDAIKELAQYCDLIIVCGSANSSNSNRLRETGEMAGVHSMMIDQAGDFDLGLLSTHRRIGISSGASVPRVIVDELVALILTHVPGARIHNFENPERKIKFPLPKTSKT